MTENHKLTREEIAVLEVGHTDVSRPVTWALTLMFLCVIVLIPLVDQCVDIFGGGETLRIPAAAEITNIAPKMKDVQKALEEHGFFQGALRINLRLLEGLSQYESALKDRSLFANTIIPPMQNVLIGWFRAGSESVYCGRDGWLFYRPALDSLTGRGFLDPPILASRARPGRLTEPIQPDPVRAIIEFRDYLKARGVGLVLLPAPSKATVYPERFSSRYDGTQAIQNSSYGLFLDRLEEAGVDVFDPAPLLVSEKTEGGAPFYLERDTHWSPSGMALAARHLAGHLNDQGLLPEGMKKEYKRETREITHKGDIAAMLRYESDSPYVQPETVTVQRVLDGEGNPWRAEKDAGILVLGDSFTNIFSLEAMGWGDAAGLAPQLAAELGQPVDTILRNDNAAYATRMELARELARGRDRLAGKRVVIWEFAARELVIGDWKTGLMPETQDAALSAKDPAAAADLASRSAEATRQLLEQLNRKIESKGGMDAWRARVQPYIQSVRDRFLTDGRGEVVELQKGYLASKGNLGMLGKRSYVVEDSGKGGESDSLRVLADLAGQLTARGIRVIVAPVPTRSSLIHEALFESMPAEPDLWPAYTEFLKVLSEKGIESVDLMSPLLDFMTTQGPVFHKTDHHWNGDGIRVAAAVLAERLRGAPSLDALSKPGSYTVTERTVPFKGWSEDKAPAGFAAPGSARVYEVKDARGEPYSDVSDAPVLIVGDSFVGHFKEFGAGLPAHLAEQLGQPVSSLWRGAGANSLPQMVAAKGAGYLDSRSAVVLLFSAHYLDSKQYEWHPAVLPKGGSVSQPQGALAAEPQGIPRLQVRAVLNAATPVPTPENIAPYTENLTVFEYRIEEVLYGTCDRSKIYVAHWGVRESKSVPATCTAQTGGVYLLNLERFEDHPELEGVNMADTVVSDFSVPVLYETAGLVNPPCLDKETRVPMNVTSAGVALPEEISMVAFTQAELQARQNEIRQDRERIERVVKKHEGWEAWNSSLNDFRHELERQWGGLAGAPDLFRTASGFLFSRSWDVSYILTPILGLDSPAKELYDRGIRSPYDVVRLLDGLLKKKNIHLIVVPVPPRGEVNPEFLLPDDGASVLEDGHPGRLRFIQALLEEDVEVVDILPAIAATKAEGGLVSLRDDSHYSPQAARAAAGEIARRVRRYGFTQNPSLQKIYSLERLIVSHKGNIASPWAEQNGLSLPDAEMVSLSRVRGPDGKLARNDDDSPVLVVGDSYGYSFQQHSADFRSYLAEHLSMPVSMHNEGAGGPRVPKLLATMGRDNLARRRVVVWIFAARYLNPPAPHNEEWREPVAF